MPKITLTKIPAKTSIKQKITDDEFEQIKELLKNFNHNENPAYKNFLERSNNANLHPKTKNFYLLYINYTDYIFSDDELLKDCLEIILYLNNNELGYYSYYRLYSKYIIKEINVENHINTEVLSFVFKILRYKENNILNEILVKILGVKDKLSEKDHQERIKNHTIEHHNSKKPKVIHKRTKKSGDKNLIRDIIDNFQKTNKSSILVYIKSRKKTISPNSLKHTAGSNTKLIGFSKQLKNAAKDKKIIIYIKSNIFIKDTIENIEKLISNEIITSDKNAFSIARRIIASLMAPGKLLNKKFKEIDQSQNEIRILTARKFIKEINREKESDINNQIPNSDEKSKENNDESVIKKPTKRKIDDNLAIRDPNIPTTIKRAMEDNDIKSPPSKKIKINGTNEVKKKSLISSALQNINNKKDFQNFIDNSYEENYRIELSKDSNFNDLINKFLELFGDQTTECELFSRKEKITGKVKAIYEIFETEIKEISERSKKDNEQNKSSEINQCKMFSIMRILNGLEKENHIDPNPNLTDKKRNITIKRSAQKI